METLTQICQRYSASDCHTGTDKDSVHSYLPVYERLLAPYRVTAKRVLEIGILCGASLRMLEEFFATARVHGIDLCDQPLGGMVDLRPMIAEGTHHITFTDATNAAQVKHHFGNLSFDVIIEDASHALEHQFSIYENFKQLLVWDGIYIIEDVDNLDAVRSRFEKIDPDRRVRIFDLRHVKNRFDDALVVIGGKDISAC